ncbi:MAG: sirohydrochlorin chelatase [Bacillota bacterium]
MKKDKKATIILSHGSKNEKSNKQFKNLVKNIELKKYDLKKGAFLEFAQPDFEKAVKDILNQGIVNITIFPLFLFAGYHVREDIPEKIIGLKNEYPELVFTLMEPIGLRKEFPKFIKKQLDFS